METIEYYKALAKALADELEEVQGELDRIKDHSFSLIGVGTVYGNEWMIKQIERKFGVGKTKLSLVEH